MFIVPAANATTHARVDRFIFNLSYIGIKAGTVIKKVTAPEPSKCTIMARRAVATATLAGSLPAILSNLLTIGRKVPASIRMPKNKMAKMNMTPVVATDLIPSVIKSIISSPRPPIRPVTMGTIINATTGDAFLAMTKYSNKTIVKRPRIANIDY